MSLEFSNPTLKSGICERIDRNCKTNTESYPLIDKASDVNAAFDSFFEIAIKASGKWQIDDSNHEKYPIVKTNLISGRRDYPFTVDEEGSLILDIFRVMVANEAGVFYELDPVDQQSDRGTESFWDGQNTTGKPSKYDKTANAVLLDVLPDYSYTLGVKMFVNREPLYFASTDTDKKPGIPGLFHEYLVLKPSYERARNDQLANKNDLLRDLTKMEQKIEEYFGQREKDVRSRLRGKNHNSQSHR